MAEGIITGRITFPADTVGNPPLLTDPSVVVPGSTLVLRREGQTFIYQDAGVVFNAVQQLDFSHEILTQPGFSDFNIFSGDGEFTGLNPGVLGSSDRIYRLVSMAPGISGQLVATDPDPNSSLVYRLDEPIAGLALNPDGSYTFDPSGPVHVSLGEGEVLAVIADWTVTDNEGASASSTLTITVNGANDEPVANAAAATDPVSGQLAASDVDDNAMLTFALDAPVPGLVVNEDGSYTFDSWDPAYAELVTGESIEVIANWTVTDNEGATASSTLTITVNGFNDTPVATAATTAATATSTPNSPGEELSFNLRWEQLGTAEGIITGSITFPADTVGNPPLFTDPSAAVPGSTLVLRYEGQTFTCQEPGFVFNAVQQLDFSTEIVTQDGFDDFNVFTGGGEFTGLNPGVLGGPDGTYHLVSMAPGISGQLVATDPDPNASLVYRLDEAIAGLAINPDGSYTFDPSEPAYVPLEEGQTLVVVANWTVMDNEGASASSTLTITVNGANDEPVAIAAAATGPVSGQLVASDVDDNTMLTFALDAPVPGLVVNEDGSYTFDPSDPAYAALGTGESIEVIANWTVTDNEGASDSSTLTITVNGFNDAPEAVAATSTVTDTAIPNDPGEELSFNLRWEETGTADGIITGSIIFPADTVGNPPDIGTSDPVGSTLVIRYGGQITTYLAPGLIFSAAQQLDFSTEIVTQDGFDDFNVFTGDGEFTGLNPGVLGRPDGTYHLVSMAPGISGQLVATDPDPDSSLVYSLDEAIAGLAINPDGSYTFDPSDPAYGSLKEGQTLLVVANWTVIDNEGASTSSTLTITVTGSAPPPLEIVNLMTEISPEGFNSFTATFSSRLGREYAIERSRDLVHWSHLLDIVGAHATTDFTDSDPIRDGQPVFYRVKEISP